MRLCAVCGKDGARKVGAMVRDASPSTRMLSAREFGARVSISEEAQCEGARGRVHSAREFDAMVRGEVGTRKFGAREFVGARYAMRGASNNEREFGA